MENPFDKLIKVSFSERYTAKGNGGSVAALDYKISMLKENEKLFKLTCDFTFIDWKLCRKKRDWRSFDKLSDKAKTNFIYREALEYVNSKKTNLKTSNLHNC